MVACPRISKIAELRSTQASVPFAFSEQDSKARCLRTAMAGWLHWLALYRPRPPQIAARVIKCGPHLFGCFAPHLRYSAPPWCLYFPTLLQGSCRTYCTALGFVTATGLADALAKVGARFAFLLAGARTIKARRCASSPDQSARGRSGARDRGSWDEACASHARWRRRRRSRSACAWLPGQRRGMAAQGRVRGVGGRVT